MPKCTWRDKPADEEKCKVMADPGKQLCPRHEMLDELRRQDRENKRVAKEHQEAAGVTGHLPRTRREMIAANWQYTGTGVCGGCQKIVEWWRTPKQRSAPFEPMPLPDSFAKSHFAVCRNAKAYRRAS